MGCSRTRRSPGSLDSVLAQVLEEIDNQDVRAAVDEDAAKLFANPQDPRLVTLDWQGQDELPWPSKIVVLGGAVVVRVAIVPSRNMPAILQAEHIERLMGKLSELIGDDSPSQRYVD